MKQPTSIEASAKATNPTPRDQQKGGAEVEAPARLETVGESPGEWAEANDRTDAVRLLRVLRVSAVLSLFFQVIYLAADSGWVEARHLAILPLHISNILTSLIFLGLTYLRAYRDRMAPVILESCTLIFAATAALSILTLNPEPLTFTVTITLVAAAALMPWNWRWQAGLAIAGAASMAASTLIRPQADPHFVYDWFAIVAAAGVAHYVALSGERYRREIKQTEADLIAAHETALAASQAKSEFLSSMSHEIRTPMNAILGMAQLLEETPLNPDQRRYLEIMTNNGDALLDLINEILDLARIESGRLSLEQAGFDLEILVDLTVETLSVRAHQKGLEMLAHVMPDVPIRLVGDRLRLRQVLLNLIGNAVKFTEKGQVLLTVGRDRESAIAGHLHFSVADTGIGIAKDKLEEVFASFTQADSSTTRQYGGSGLGLAIVRRLVGLMGGRVWVESELGRGSVFHFTAQFQVQADAPVERHPAMTAMLRGVRALVVDDNSTNRLILREMLSSRGAEVDEAEDGPAALEHIERARSSGIPYKLMLLDCRMPGMDGFQVAQRLQAGTEQGLTVLMLSSDDLKVQVSRARKLGLDAYLVKPVRRTDLFEAIATAMANHATGVIEPGQTGALASTPGTAPNIQPDLPLSILLADDSKDNRLLIHAYLKDTGYRLDDAENGALAVAKLKAGNYDLVLMDIQMPVMDGLEATRAIRAWEQERSLSRTPILALTASALDEDVRRVLEAGVDLHVSKPIKKVALIAAIKKSTRSPAALAITKNPNDAAA